MAFENLRTMAEVNAERRATPKHQIVPAVVARKERKASKEQKGIEFRDAVWKRDKGRDRATGRKLQRVHPKQPGAALIPWDQVGEVDHSYPRSTHPEHIYTVKFGLLISKELNRLRKVVCSEDPTFRMFDYEAVTPGDDDRGKPQRFIWRRPDGSVLKERIG